MLITLVVYRLIDPGSEWRLHRHWYEQSAVGDLLEEDFSLAAKDNLYRCLDRLLEHREKLFKHLQGRWRDEFGAKFDVLLYDLTSTYFESDPPLTQGSKRRFGYSRDKRPDCVQVVIALIVTPEGYPLAYEVLPGNTSDKTTLKIFLDKIEQLYGKAHRVWVMDRGIPTEEVIEQMQQADPKVLWEYYLQLVAIEAAFRNLKGDLQIRPIFHQKDQRIEAHIFVAYLAYCLQVTLQGKLRPVAGGLTPRTVLEKFGTIQMMDVYFPTEQPGKELMFRRYTQPDKDHQMLLAQLGWQLPQQPPPRLSDQGQLLK